MFYPENDNPNAKPGGICLDEMDDDNAFWLHTLRKQREQKAASQRVKEKNYWEILQRVQEDLNIYLNKGI